MDGDGEDLATFESDAESRAYGEREMVTPRLPAAEPEPPREAPGSAAKPLLDDRRSLDDQGTPVQYTRALDDEAPEAVAAPNFFVDGVAYRFADRALGCVPPSSGPRKRAVAVVVHPAFDAVILVAILVNAAFMGMVDYGSVGEDPDLEMYYKPKGGWRNDLRSSRRSRSRGGPTSCSCTRTRAIRRSPRSSSRAWSSSGLLSF